MKILIRYDGDRHLMTEGKDNEENHKVPVSNPASMAETQRVEATP
jgi:hypothetical protein